MGGAQPRCRDWAPDDYRGDGTSVPMLPAGQPGHAAWLLLSDERDQALRMRQQAYRDGWNACLDYIADAIGGRILPAHPGELELLRYGPGGRAHAGDPRPGDYPGRAAA